MQASEFLKQFAQPDPRFSPVPMWWWSGERLEIGRLRWQMDQLLAMGIHNVLIINLAPNGTLFGCDPDDPPFLSEAWWLIFEQVCDHAKSIGMFIWFYDQIGFSGASFQADITVADPEYLAQQLGRVFVEGTSRLTLECPPHAQPVAAYVFPRSRPKAIQYVPIEDHRASVEVKEPSRFCLVSSQRQGYNFFSRPACEELLKTVHGQFARRLPQHLGTTIVGSFQDELPDLPTWAPDFDQTFQEENGYRLSDVIHHLFEVGGADARRTRLRYHEHRARLAEEAFFKPFFHWHEERGLQCGFDQQSPVREARVLGSVVKYADYIQTHRWYAIPGSDLHGNGKLHSSIAFMYSRPRVWIEGFHSTGWGGTIADTFDWLLPYLRSGANLYNPHAVYYSTRQGWWEWAPPSTCWRQPYAMHYLPFAQMITRLTKLLSQGIQQANLGVLFPSATVQSSLGCQDAFADAESADRTLHETIGSMRWHQAKLGPLDEMAIDFHLLDEATIASAGLEKDALIFRDVRFRTIVLPHVTFLHDATLDRLQDFAEMGGQIIAIGAGDIETETGRRVHITSIPNASFIESAKGLGALMQHAPRLIGSPVPTLYRRKDDIHILLVPAVAGMATVVKWPSWFEPMEHTTIVPERYRQTADLTLPASAKVVWRFDPWTGKSQRLESTGPNLLLDFEGSPFAVLVWSEWDEDSTRFQTTALPAYEIELADEWKCEFVPTLPTGYADIYDPRHAEVRWPITTDFKWYRGQPEADFSRGLPSSLPTEMVRATFGIRAWRTDASSPTAKPIIYSPYFGIQQDAIHIHTLGPKGYVPEEFIDLGNLTAGERVTIGTGVVSESERDVMLAVGANATKVATVNGVSMESSGSEYLWLAPAKLRRGDNTIDLRFTAERSGAVRLFWGLLDPNLQHLFARPERITAQGTPIAGASLVYRRQFELSEPVAAGEVKVSIAAGANVFLDGSFLGRQGGFDPYRPMMRGQTYPTPALAIGPHELRVEVFEPKPGALLTVDLASGDFVLMSDRHWTASRNTSEELPVRIHDNQSADGGTAWHLRRRPHPLPEVAFGESRTSPAVVFDIPLLLPHSEAVAQWFEWTIPPGAISMNLDVEGDAILWIDGTREQIDVDGLVMLSGVDNPPARTAVLRVLRRQLAGGVFHKAVLYQFKEGTFKTGSWLTQGLRSYSGAVRLRQSFNVVHGKGDRVILNLGQVRGTVQAQLNGQDAGICCLSPYRFDLTDFVKSGVNDLELLATNTLANHLSTSGPTRWWSPDQLEAGIFGPVQVIVGRATNAI